MKKKIMLLLFILFVASANVIVHAEEQDTQEVITNAFNDKWEELEALKNGDNGANVNYNSIKLL